MMSAAAEVVLTTPRELATGSVRFAEWLTRGIATLRQLAPYAAIELLLPGGSLIALVLWIYRRHVRKQPLENLVPDFKHEEMSGSGQNPHGCFGQ
jgi:hypothetical protein